ncbi:hypothetical protein BDAP_001034 [Binucleata daphniae]
MVEINEQNLSNSVRNICSKKKFLLLFLFINIHITATTNPKNSHTKEQISREAVNKKYDSQQHKSYINFLSQKFNKHFRMLEVYLKKCIREELPNLRNNEQKSSNSCIKLNKVKKTIALYLDEFRISINSDFATYYNQDLMNQDPFLFNHNHLYNLCTIYNFSMLDACKSHIESACIAIKNTNNDYNTIKEAKRSSYYALLRYNKNYTDICIKDIEHNIMINDVKASIDISKNITNYDKTKDTNTNIILLKNYKNNEQIMDSLNIHILTIKQKHIEYCKEINNNDEFSMQYEINKVNLNYILKTIENLQTEAETSYLNFQSIDQEILKNNIEKYEE